MHDGCFLQIRLSKTHNVSVYQKTQPSICFKTCGLAFEMLGLAFETKRTESINVTGILLDENLIWKPHIKYIENEIAWNIATFLIKRYLSSLCYSYIHSYISYANVAWRSTYMTNFKNYLVNKSMQCAEFVVTKKNLGMQKSYFIQKKISMYINWIS